jgi:hypothetical protein
VNRAAAGSPTAAKYLNYFPLRNEATFSMLRT